MVSSAPDAFYDESTPKRTPLPFDQIVILLFLRFCESASTFVIFPFLNEVRISTEPSSPSQGVTLAPQLLASVTGGDRSKVGYYAGIMVRLHPDILYHGFCHQI